mmetsp:Transcript_10839/g.16151  ORF Transcript_10839/g.16151 Transcript_10839/m.16151 type:complete len:657 (-) Transcript_10839:214-2184(-)
MDSGNGGIQREDGNGSSSRGSEEAKGRSGEQGSTSVVWSSSSLRPAPSTSVTTNNNLSSSSSGSKKKRRHINRRRARCKDCGCSDCDGAKKGFARPKNFVCPASQSIKNQFKEFITRHPRANRGPEIVCFRCRRYCLRPQKKEYVIATPPGTEEAGLLAALSQTPQQSITDGKYATSSSGTSNSKLPMGEGKRVIADAKQGVSPAMGLQLRPLPSDDLRRSATIALATDFKTNPSIANAEQNNVKVRKKKAQPNRRRARCKDCGCANCPGSKKGFLRPKNFVCPAPGVVKIQFSAFKKRYPRANRRPDLPCFLCGIECCRRSPLTTITYPSLLSRIPSGMTALSTTTSGVTSLVTPVGSFGSNALPPPIPPPLPVGGSGFMPQMQSTMAAAMKHMMATQSLAPNLMLPQGIQPGTNAMIGGNIAAASIARHRQSALSLPGIAIPQHSALRPTSISISATLPAPPSMPAGLTIPAPPRMPPPPPPPPSMSATPIVATTTIMPPPPPLANQSNASTRTIIPASTMASSVVTREEKKNEQSVSTKQSPSQKYVNPITLEKINTYSSQASSSSDRVQPSSTSQKSSKSIATSSKEVPTSSVSASSSAINSTSGSVLNGKMEVDSGRKRKYQDDQRKTVLGSKRSRLIDKDLSVPQSLKSR